MKIVVISGTGLIGSKLVTTLRERGHDVVAAARETGIDSVTGEGLTEALTGAAVVIDASSPPSCGDAGIVKAFTASTRNLLAYGAAAGVRHHVALSAVGTSRLLESGHFRARCAQETLIKQAAMPYSIVRVTPLFEQLGAIAGAGTHGAVVRVPPVRIQPIAADDVAHLLAQVAVATPLNGIVEAGGPEPFYLDGLVQRILGANRDTRTVVADAHARYFGAEVSDSALVAGDEAELGAIRFEDWLRDTAFRGAAGTGASNGRAPLGAHEFRVSDVPSGSVLLLGDVAVFSVAGGFCATQAMCTHRDGPLSEGAVDDMTVTCPLHGSQFNIWTGAVLRGPALEPLKTYRVVVNGDVGRVDVD